MTRESRPGPTAIVIFGAAGDLTWRKLVPALYCLYLDGWMPEHFAIIGVDRKNVELDEYHRKLREGVDRFSRQGCANDADWSDFTSRLTFMSGNFSEDDCYAALKDRLDGVGADWDTDADHVFYLAVPPALIETITQKLGQSGLAARRERSRIVVEKPFGRDLESARALNRLLTGVFDESQIYRIDHYLGKETVQNVLAFRFANALFEPIWDRRYIDHVQITVAEDVGVGHRGDYYESAGALRDMIQNHLMQILCLIAMEPPVSFEADEIRSKKVDVLHAIRPIAARDVPNVSVRGQYAAGWLRGEHVRAYRDEADVARDSNVETFAALKLFVDDWRWQDIPFYLRTGKRMPTRLSEVSIHFRPVPHQSFPPGTVADLEPNRLRIDIQPHEGILLRFQAKRPGLTMHLSPVEMRFTYHEAFQATPPDAYETLLLDVMRGDATQFMRADQIEAAWSIIMPILEVWGDSPPGDFPDYRAGTWGPEAAVALLARDGRLWLTPDQIDDPPAEKEDEEPEDEG
jgi:glucose-6-phosphate 1-dehydrogenase